MAPAQVTRNNYRKVYKRLNPLNDDKKLCKLSKGDLVRIALKKNIFHKGYRQNFSDEIYKIKKTIQTDTVCYYIVTDISEEIEYKKYYEELSLVGRTQ